MRANNSLWESVLAWISIEPDRDCAPQVASDGSVPLVEAYLALFQRNGVSGRIVKWGGITRGANGWEVRALLSVTRGAVTTEEGRVFLVANREVSGASPIAWK